MTDMGIHFERIYKKEHRRFWQCCIVSLVTTTALIVVSYNCYSFRASNQLIDMIEYFTSFIPQNCSLVQISVSFLILLYSIYQRFAALNSILRWRSLLPIFKISFCIKGLKLWNLYFFRWSRDRFLNENIVQTEESIQKDSSIKTIKFIGLQYSRLTTIVDQTNHCYSFQV